MSKQTHIIWRLPKEAAHTIVETLELDTQSGAFDPVVRKEIGDALSSITDATEDLTALIQKWRDQAKAIDCRIGCDQEDLERRDMLFSCAQELENAITKAESKA